MGKGFAPRWVFSPSHIPGFWVGTPQVPGGQMRVMIQDDFGNAVDVPGPQFYASMGSCSH